MGNPNDSPVQTKKRRKYQRVTRKPEVQDAVRKPRIGSAVATLGASRAGALWRAENARWGENGGQSDLAFDARGLFEGGTVEAQADLLHRLAPAQRQEAIQRIARVQGNQHVQRLVVAYGGNGKRRVSSPIAVQTKLEVGEPDDVYEQEADAVAEQVMRMSSAAPPSPPGEEDDGDNGSSPHTSAVPYEEIQASGDVVSAVTPDVENRIQNMKGTGAPLPNTERTYFEERFGADFSGVRVHTGDVAAQTSQDLSARAYTVGSDIAFGAGEYAPGTDKGRRLMAHELTHVVQQGGAGALQREPEDKIRRSEEEEPSGGGGEAAAPPVPASGSGPAKPASEGEGGVPRPGGNGAGPRGAVTPAVSTTPGESAGDNGAGAQVAEALAEGSKAPSSPGEDPGFQAVTGRVDGVAEQEQTHEEPVTEAEEAQEAAESPTNEVESQAQDQQVQEMEQQEPGEFSAAAFKAALLAKIQEVTPKKLKDVDEFKKKNRISSVKQDLEQKIADQKCQTIGPLEEKVGETPDTSEIEPKPVTPMEQPDVGPPPPDVGAQEAAPKPKTTDEIETPLQQESQALDQELDEAGITEQQLTESNEPEFLAALDAKKQAQTYAQESPQGYRQQEAQIVAGAEQEAQTAVVAPLDGMHSGREDLLGAVFGEQYDTKAADEGKRGEVATAINGIYEATKQDVESNLEALGSEVEKMFDAAAEKARKLFEDYVDREMKAYKKKRYGGLFGKAKWLKDKLLGMPKEVNKFYEDGRKLYIDTMDVALDGIAEHVATKLNETMARIAKGRQEIQEYVESLPEELQQIGVEAANEIQTKFDDLEQDVKDKQTELIDTLASKYQENLQELDARIEELKAANRGLIAKAIDFVKNVIATVVQLAAMLARILMKAAAAIPKIILNPIGFLKNLLQGVKQGLRNFVKNIGQHLQSAVLEWLTGATGLQLPATLDAKGLFDLVLQVLGLTYANIRERAVNIFGEKTVAYLEKGFEVFKILVTEGPAGLWEYIKDKVGDLKAMVIDRIKDLIKTKIIQAGINWIISSLGGPAGAFIQAVKTIVKVVKWFLENAKKIMALIDAVLDAILAIASGSVDAAANKIEEALARQIPVVLSFLADLVGIGDLSGSVRKIIADVRKPINSAIDWVLKKVKEFVIKMGHKLGIGEEEETEEEKQERLQQALEEARDSVNARFGGKEVSGEELGSALGTRFGEIKQTYGLATLGSRVAQDKERWQVEGVIQRETMDTEAKPSFLDEVLETLLGGLMGEFKEDPTYAMMGVDFGISLIPFIDQGCDIRDIIAHLYYMIFKGQYESLLRWVGLVFTLVGLIPEVGSAIKSASKAVIRLGCEAGSRYLDDFLALLRKRFPDVSDSQELINRLVETGISKWGEVKSRGIQKWDEALGWATDLGERARKALEGKWLSVSQALSDKARKLIETLPEVKRVTPRKLGEAFDWVREKVESLPDLFRRRKKGDIEVHNMSVDEFREALAHAFPGRYLDNLMRSMGDIGEAAADSVVSDPDFIKALKDDKWTTAGTLFHSAAKREGEKLAKAGNLPSGYHYRFEFVAQKGKGGSRLDVLVQDTKTGEWFEFDWKTTGRSALTKAARDEMSKHKGHLVANLKVSPVSQLSISWVDFVRPKVTQKYPNVNIKWR